MVLAGLLYLVGAAAEPLVHAYAAGQDSGVVLVGDAGDGSGQSDPSLPHDESQCLLCKIAAPLVVPEGGPVVAYQLSSAASVFLLSTCSRAPPAFVSPQPRAPPLA
jgi:hypothetical protein